ncbi:hypothetical protein K3495_g12867 [Podosphaera aphanis]|nr:hypothetical protein K3495_g12867 [Podosphaera aphanis]
MRFCAQIIVSLLSLLTCVSAKLWTGHNVPSGATPVIHSIVCGVRSYSEVFVDHKSLELGKKKFLEMKEVPEFDPLFPDHFDGPRPYHTIKLGQTTGPNGFRDELVVDKDGRIIGAITRSHRSNLDNPDYYTRCDVKLQLSTWVCHGYRHRNGMKKMCLEWETIEEY